MTSSRIGSLNSDGQFVFSCGNCGGMAAELAVVAVGPAVDLGPLPGGERLVQQASRPTVKLTFLSISARAAPAELLHLVSDAQVLDARQVMQIDPDLAPFLCPDCDVPYCTRCWTTTVEFDDGFYDGTRGECPQGHRHLIDD